MFSSAYWLGQDTIYKNIVTAWFNEKADKLQRENRRFSVKIFYQRNNFLCVLHGEIVEEWNTAKILARTMASCMLEERSSDGVLEGFCVPNGKQMATEIMEIVDCALLTTPLRLTQCVMEIRKDAPITVTLNIYNWKCFKSYTAKV